MSIEIIKPSGGGGGGITSLNGLTASAQLLAVGTSGTDFAISSSVDTNTFNLPTASAINRGALSSADWTTFNSKGNGTVTSVAALTLGTTGTDLSSTVANGTTTPVITLNVPTASATNRGALSSANWTTFNSKQDALVSGTNIKTINSTSILGSGNLVVAATPSGVSGAVQFSDGSALASDATNLFYDNTNDRLGLGINAPTARLHVKGTGATSATNSILVQNSSSNQTFSVRDDGVVFVGLGGLLSGSVKFQVKDQSDNVCLAVSQSDTVFGNSTVLRSMDGILYPTGNIIFRNGNPNSAIINFGDSEVNSASATGNFSFIKFTRNWTSVAPSLNLSINVQETNNVINMTNGTGTKIFRGIYHNPTVTAVTSHRAFESSSGGGYFNTTSVDASSVLQADSTTQGFLPPRMTNAQRAAIVSPAEGLLVHNTTNKGTAYYDGTNWGYLNGAAQTIAGSGGTVNIPFASGNIVDLTLTASTTLTFSGHVVGVYILKVIQGGTGSYTLTYPATVKWSGGTPPTLTTTVGKTDIITLFHDGTNFFGTYSLNY
jgi:hypothetical protein